jgi:hypothetical protein
MDQRFVALNDRIQGLRKQLDEAGKEYMTLLIEVVPELEGASVTVGHHECPHSPNGVCVYDNCHDPCHDECLFCDEPEDRQ